MGKSEKKAAGRKKLTTSLWAVLGGFVVGFIVVIITGKNPLMMLNAMFQAFSGISIAYGSFNPRYIGEFIINVIPIVMTALCFAFASRTGLFNIGAEGQLLLGSIGAMIVALTVKAPVYIHVPLILIAGMVGGALWGAIPGFLKAKFAVHEVVVTIMLNYVALHLNNWVVISGYNAADTLKTPQFPASALLKSEFLESITNGSRLHWGFIPMILAIVAYWFIIEKTTFGFSLRAVGYNKDGAQFAGMKVKRNIVLSMMIAGAFAGLGGAIMTTGTFSFGRALFANEGYGFDGMTVALVGQGSAVGILLAGFLFGMLKAASPLMQSAGIPKEIAGIIQAAIVLFVAMKYGIELLQAWFENRKQKKLAAQSASPLSAETNNKEADK